LAAAGSAAGTAAKAAAKAAATATEAAKATAATATATEALLRMNCHCGAKQKCQDAAEKFFVNIGFHNLPLHQGFRELISTSA
jgi:hypothetical protein